MLFDFKCCSCGLIEEYLVKSTQNEMECPKCRSVMRRISSFSGNFSLKGGGWFADGYSKSKGGPADQ